MKAKIALHVNFTKLVESGFYQYRYLSQPGRLKILSVLNWKK